MKIFGKILLGVIFMVLIVFSVQHTSAEQNIPIKGILASEITELVTTQDSKWQIYLQLSIRNVDGQLINVTESTAFGAYIEHTISDHVFDTLMVGKEIVTVNGNKYEKAQWEFNPSLEHRFVGLYPIYSELTLNLVSTHGDETAKMYESKKDYSHWKIHYCADFDAVGYSCVPVFQALVPTMTMEPTDSAELQWTILRELK